MQHFLVVRFCESAGRPFASHVEPRKDDLGPLRQPGVDRDVAIESAGVSKADIVGVPRQLSRRFAGRGFAERRTIRPPPLAAGGGMLAQSDQLDNGPVRQDGAKPRVDGGSRLGNRLFRTGRLLGIAGKDDRGRRVERSAGRERQKPQSTMK